MDEWAVSKRYRNTDDGYENTANKAIGYCQQQFRRLAQ